MNWRTDINQLLPKRPVVVKSWRQQLIGVPVRIGGYAAAVHIGRIGPIKEIHGTVAVIDFTTPDKIELVHVDLRGLFLIPKPQPKPTPKRRLLSILTGAV